MFYSVYDLNLYFKLAVNFWVKKKKMGGILCCLRSLESISTKNNTKQEALSHSHVFFH